MAKMAWVAMATANPSISESAIEQITAGRGPHHEPFGWHHWPEYRWFPGSPTNFAGRSVRPRKGAAASAR